MSESADMSAALVIEPTRGVQICGPCAAIDDKAIAQSSNFSETELACDKEECSETPDVAEEAPDDTEDTPMQEQCGNTCSPATSAQVAAPPALAALAAGSTLPLWTHRRDGEVKLRLSESGPTSVPPLTVHELLLRAVQRFGDCTALAWKVGDQWEKLTYQEYYQRCRTVAKAFLKLGLERYHGVGILGFNSPEWFMADIGAILAGGFAVGIYATNSPDACQYVAENCQANILVVEDHKQLQKILQVRDKLPHLKAIIQYKDALKEKQPNLFTWAELMEMGRDEPDGPLDGIIASQKPNQCCTLVYTSGTTGLPKGVMLSHDNLTWTAFTTSKTVHLDKPDVLPEIVISYLPLSHIAAQMIDMWIIMTVGGATYFAQPDALKGSLGNTLREVRPTAFMGVPRVWEKMQEAMRAAGAKSSTVRKKVVVWAKGVGLHTNMSRMQGNSANSRRPLQYRLAKKLVFDKVRRLLGLDRCTKCYTGAAPISKETLEFFLSLDIPVYELYGMSESTGPHTISLPEAFRLISCGKVIQGCQSKIIDPDSEGIGEVCFWGRHVFMGYLNMAEQTEEVLDSEGWLHSGDLGKHDEQDFLFITGRIKELIITAGGENIPPVLIENAVKEAMPLISNAMVIGDQRKFLSMLLTVKCQVNADTGVSEDELTPEAVELCRKMGSNASRVSEIAGGKDQIVSSAIQKAIDYVNERAASNAQRIQKWVVLGRDFSIPGGELGPTMKVKRPVVLRLYREQIEAFYKEAASDNAAPPS